MVIRNTNAIPFIFVFVLTLHMFYELITLAKVLHEVQEQYILENSLNSCILYSVWKTIHNCSLPCLTNFKGYISVKTFHTSFTLIISRYIKHI